MKTKEKIDLRIKRKSEVIGLKEYAKAVMYAYPLLQSVEKDYEEHIQNKALLSFNGKENTEKLMEYIAEEIIEKEKLAWLKIQVQSVLSRLNEEERALVEIRYFGKKKLLKSFVKGDEEINAAKWSKRTYFRRQKRLQDKLTALFTSMGVTEEKYDREYACIGIFKKVDKLMQRGYSSS